MKLKVYIPDGSACLEKEFAIPEFEGEKGLDGLKQLIVAYGARKRQGNASTKTRAEVSGTGRKPHRQKGTGSARQGSRRTPLWRGGGVAFGPKPRDYSRKVNRKMRRLAFKRALFDRASSGDIDVIERFESEKPRTSAFNGVMERIAPEGKVLIVDDTFSDAVLLSARNISRVFATASESLNAWELCRYDKILMSEKGMEKVLDRIEGGTDS